MYNLPSAPLLSFQDYQHWSSVLGDKLCTNALVKLKHDCLDWSAVLFLARHKHAPEFIRAIDSMSSKEAHRVHILKAFELVLTNACRKLDRNMQFKRIAYNQCLAAKAEQRMISHLLAFELDLSICTSKRLLEWSCCSGQTDIVERLLNRGIDPAFDENQLICLACFYGHLKIVVLLLRDKRVDPSATGNRPIYNACTQGHFEIARELLNHPAVGAQDNECAALKDACLEGHEQIVKLLLTQSHTKQQLTIPLRNAVSRGHLAVVKLLLHSFGDEIGHAAAIVLPIAIINRRIVVSRYLIAISDKTTDGYKDEFNYK
jgi:ankyrin repeat protein